MSLFLDDLEVKLDEIINEKYDDSENGSWEENEITSSILKSIKNYFISNNYFNKEIHWNVYKCRGELEKSYGDIAFIIRIYFSQDKYIEGTYFIEAKRFYYDKNRYESIKLEQLKKLVSFSQSHHTILYKSNNEKDFLGKYNNIKVLPTQHLITLDEKNEDIEKYTESFINLLESLFNGKYLDYRKESVDSAKGFVSNTGLKFKYIVNTSISLENNIKSKLSHVNRKYYTNINEFNKKYNPSVSNTHNQLKP